MPETVLTDEQIEAALMPLLADLQHMLKKARKREVGGNITIHLDDNGIPSRIAELKMYKASSMRRKLYSSQD